MEISVPPELEPARIREEAIEVKNARSPFKTGSERREGGLRLTGRMKRSLRGKPLISVVTPVLNRKNIFSRSLQSVLNQTYNNVEYIVVDGGSTDGTLDVLLENDASIDYWVSEPDGGIADAFNKAARLATGKWILFLGADDILLNILHEVAPLMKKGNHIYYGDVFRAGPNGIWGGIFDNFRLMRENLCQQSIFYPKDVFKKYEHDSRYEVWMDYEFNLRCWGDHSFKPVYLPYVISVFGGGGNCFGYRHDSAFVRERKQLFERAFPKEMMLRAIGRKIRRARKHFKSFRH